MSATESVSHAAPSAATKPSGPASRSRILVYQILFICGFFAVWELAVSMEWAPVYLYGQPSGIYTKTITLLQEGELLTHLGLTAFEAITGFIIGTTLGSLCGLALWLSDMAARIFRPIIVAINGVPKIALAPLIVVWFGVGIGAKVAIAASLTFIVALITVYQGTKEIDIDLIKLMRSLGASNRTVWKKVIIPGSVPWIMSTLRLNIGFAMIGAVVGEYISAKQGIGYFIYNAGAVYDLNAVFVGIFGLMFLALLLDYILIKVEEKFKW